MTSWYHSWVAAVRIARRDAWRSKGRSALVLAMIALPILGVSATDVTLRSAELSPEQRLARTLGAADARVEGTGMGGTPIVQDPKATNWAPAGGYKDGTEYPDAPTNVRAALPPGSTVLKDTSGDARVRTRYGLLSADVRELDVKSPLAAGMLTLNRGRYPTGPGEIAATDHFLESAGLYVGSKVVLRGMEGSPLRVVGAYELPSELKDDELLAAPGTLLPRLDGALKAAGLRALDTTSTYFVRTGADGGFTWDMVRKANAKGALVLSKQVSLHPPADSEVPYYQQESQRDYGGSAAADAEALAVVATVVMLAMLEICLLAGPAFAVGARRSRRQLGLVGANGGDRHHIRAIVLSGGLVIGATAAVVGTALGLLLTWALRPVLEDQLGNRFGDFEARPLELLGIALLAVVTGLLAAIVPAFTASRQTVLASLTGRRGVRRANRVLPVVGLVAVGIGAAVALYGSTRDSGGFLMVGGGSALAELGVVALTPTLVGLFGRAGRWLPLSPRLALRDAVRNRGRTAPAVAAVLAAVAGTVAVATYSASTDAQHRAEYDAKAPYLSGWASAAETASARDLPAVRAAMVRELPLAVRTDVERIYVGKPGCDPWDMGDGCGQLQLNTPKDKRCPRDGVRDLESLPPEKLRAMASDWRCKPVSKVYAEQEVLVGDEKLLTVLGITDPGAVRALRDGQAVAFSKANVTAGRISFTEVTDEKKAAAASDRGEDAPGRTSVVPAHLTTADGYGLRAIVSPAAAKAAGLKTVALGTYFTLDQEPTTEQRQALDAALDRIGTEIGVYVERGYESETGIETLALTVFAGLVTIGAAGIATGLAQADAEADLKTLAAVGAAPRVRRTLSGFQCGVVAAMGVLLGSASGILPAVGLRWSEQRSQESFYQQSVASGWGVVGEGPAQLPVVVPWQTLALLLVAVPVGAALLAALVTRSSGALARRAAQ
ncbi:ABC transporter permease [Streptomyces sp. NRRL S-87]|uniref:ABC transporter permease n=1 Tax=Streptomyces sp. NRRL S-87 TaxID=1463920 RepID=UPI0004BED26E|nr:ABC transporter permease [Streptomyces sp. NRRL S-87]